MSKKCRDLSTEKWRSGRYVDRDQMHRHAVRDRRDMQVESRETWLEIREMSSWRAGRHTIREQFDVHLESREPCDWRSGRHAV